MLLGAIFTITVKYDQLSKDEYAKAKVEAIDLQGPLGFFAINLTIFDDVTSIPGLGVIQRVVRTQFTPEFLLMYPTAALQKSVLTGSMEGPIRMGVPVYDVSVDVTIGPFI